MINKELTTAKNAHVKANEKSKKILENAKTKSTQKETKSKNLDIIDEEVHKRLYVNYSLRDSSLKSN